MTIRSTRELEARILKLAEELIQATIAAGLLEGEEKETHSESAARIAEQICILVVELLEGKEEHLEIVLEQLTLQKLPEAHVLESFGNFPQDLRAIINRGIALYRNRAVSEGQGSWEETFTPKGVSVYSGSLDQVECQKTMGRNVMATGPKQETPLKLALKMVYPGSRIIENYEMRGFILQYYLPEQRLAVEEAGFSGESELKRYWCNQLGIRLLKVDGQPVNARRLARNLKRMLV